MEELRKESARRRELLRQRGKERARGGLLRRASSSIAEADETEASTPNRRRSSIVQPIIAAVARATGRVGCASSEQLDAPIRPQIDPQLDPSLLETENPSNQGDMPSSDDAVGPMEEGRAPTGNGLSPGVSMGEDDQARMSREFVEDQGNTQGENTIVQQECLTSNDSSSSRPLRGLHIEEVALNDRGSISGQDSLEPMLFVPARRLSSKQHIEADAAYRV